MNRFTGGFSSVGEPHLCCLAATLVLKTRLIGGHLGVLHTASTTEGFHLLSDRLFSCNYKGFLHVIERWLVYHIESISCWPLMDLSALTLSHSVVLLVEIQEESLFHICGLVGCTVVVSLSVFFQITRNDVRQLRSLGFSMLE